MPEQFLQAGQLLSLMGGALPQPQQVSPMTYIGGAGSVYMSPFQPASGLPQYNPFSGYSRFGQLGMVAEALGPLLYPMLNKFATQHGVSLLQPYQANFNYVMQQRENDILASLAETKVGGRSSAQMSQEMLSRSLQSAMMQVHPEMGEKRAAELARGAAAHIYSIGGMLRAFIPMPGFEAEQFARGIYQGQRAMGIMPTPEQAVRGAQALMGAFFRQTPTGTEVNQQFAQGLTAPEMQQVVHILGREGMLSANPERMVQQVGQVNRIVRMMRELMGNPDAPIPQVIQNLQAITGGALGRVNPEQIRNSIDRMQAVARALNISTAGVMRFLEASTTDARARGLSPIAGYRAGLAALESVQAARAASVDLGTAGLVRIGAPTTAERLKFAERRELALRGSEYGQRLGAMLALREINPERFANTAMGAEINKLLQHQQEGTMTNEEARRLYTLIDPAQYFQLARTVGVTEQTARRIMRDRAGNALRTEEAGLFTGLGTERFRRVDMAHVLAMRLSPEVLRRLGVQNRAAAQRIIEQIIAGGDIRQVRNIIARATGREAGATEVGAMAAELETAARRTFGGEYGNDALFEMLRTHSDRALLRRQETTQDQVQIQRELREAFTRRGVVISSRSGIHRAMMRLVRDPKLGQNIIQLFSSAIGTDTGVLKDVAKEFDDKVQAAENELKADEETGKLDAMTIERRRNKIKMMQMVAARLRRVAGEEGKKQVAKEEEDKKAAEETEKEATKTAKAAETKGEERKQVAQTRPVTIKLTIDNSQVNQVKQLVLTGEMNGFA